MEFVRKNKKKIAKVASLFLVASFFIFLIGTPDCFAVDLYKSGAYLSYKNPMSFFNPNNYVFEAIHTLLVAIFVLMGWLLIIPIVLFKWILDPATLTLFMNSDAVRDVWTMVRDFFNLFFIFTLLFSAFATIFQVESYHIKKIIFKLILMALLVNFSYPIARFIIDISNVLLYWLVNGIFQSMNDGAGFGAALTLQSGMAKILTPDDFSKYPITYLIMCIIFVFIFAVTLIVIAVMFVIRLVMLSVLVMFSPAGFVSFVFPATAKYGRDWWDTLIKQAFFAPIMVFAMAVALKMITAIGPSANEALVNAANTQTAGGDGGAFSRYLASVGFMVVPLSVLWLGMGAAQKLSIMGASAVTGHAQKFSKWVGKNWGGARPIWRSTGIPGGVKQGVAKFQKNGKLFGVKMPLYTSTEEREEREAKWAGYVSGGKEGKASAVRDHERKKINEMRKDWKDQGGADEKDLHEALKEENKKKNPIKAQAAALELAEKHKFKDLNEYKEAKKSVGDDPVLKKVFEDKAKEKHIKFVIEDHIERAKENLAKKGKTITDDAINGIYEKHLSGMDNDNLAKQKGLHENIVKDTHLQKYIRERFTDKPQQFQKFFGNLSGGNQKAYAKANLSKPMRSQSGGQGQSQGQNQAQNQSQPQGQGFPHFTHPTYQNQGQNQNQNSGQNPPHNNSLGRRPTF